MLNFTVGRGLKLVLCCSFIIFTATHKSLQYGCSKILIYYSWLGFIGYGTVWFYRHILLYGVHTHFVVLEFLIGAENILQLLLINKGLSGGMRLFLCVCSKTKGRQTEQLLRKYNKREDDIYGKLSYCVFSSYFSLPNKEINRNWIQFIIFYISAVFDKHSKFLFSLPVIWGSVELFFLLLLGHWYNIILFCQKKIFRERDNFLWLWELFFKAVLKFKYNEYFFRI